MRKENFMYGPNGSRARMCCASCDNYYMVSNGGKFTSVCRHTGARISRLNMFCGKYSKGKYFREKGYMPKKY